jgi:folate-binding protein YgfZ
MHEAYAIALADSRRSMVHSGSRPGAAVGQKVESGIEWLGYGIAERDDDASCELIATYGDVEPEYAAIRRGAALFDSAHRGVIRVTGKDRVEFLDRMLTQELKGFARGMVKTGFWLNRKGRIEADLMLACCADEILMDVDVHQAAGTTKSLSEFVFSEDVAISDVSAEVHRLSLHGRLALLAMAEASQRAALELDDRSSIELEIAGVRVTAARRDQTGEIGLELFVPKGDAPAIWKRLNEIQLSPRKLPERVRPIGWYAFNVARIEAGTPLFNVDFGTTNLPHESGLLADRVSFSKGCYPGQEIVARMQNLGKPKQMLVGLAMQSDLLPVAGAQIFARSVDGAMGEQIGVITSSTLSPMLSASPIAFGMIKAAFAQPGAILLVNAEGEQASARIGPLQFWSAPRSGASSALSSEASPT